MWCYNGHPKTQQVRVSRMEASTPEDPLGNLTAFADLADPRDSARCCYPLQELLLVALAGVASGAEDWVDVAYWGRMKLEWLRRWLPFERGIASHDSERPAMPT